MLNSNFPFYIPFCMMLTSMCLPFSSEHIHPLTFMVFLIIYTLAVSLTINFNNYFIYSYILFLIMVGGMMIMFLYFISLINNEKSKIYPFTIKCSMYMITSFTLIFFWKSDMLQYTFISINNWILDYYLDKEQISIYSEIHFETTSLLIYFLYLSMVMVIKLCKQSTKPLRKLRYVQFILK
uniref:NADH dehydrogenase subunit 6 n=1 Tax=Diodontus guichardi TaxID=2555506 RepID=A0A5J6DQF2_9HYME|nr:NADH dehydrogenase subunit 6 [Diodontus guichardi]